MSPEIILSKHSINNPSDAALIRLAHSAAAFPKEPVEPLLERSNIRNDLDKALGRALVESVRAGLPLPVTPVPTGAAKALRVSIVACVLALLGLLGLNVKTDRENDQLRLAKAATESKLAALESQTANASTELTKQATLFTSSTGDFISTTNKLASDLATARAEIQQLKDRNAALTGQLDEARKK